MTTSTLHVPVMIAGHCNILALARALYDGGFRFSNYGGTVHIEPMTNPSAIPAKVRAWFEPGFVPSFRMFPYKWSDE